MNAWAQTFPRLRRVIAPLLLLFLAPPLMQSAAPPAGTSIGNQASATYTDASDTERTATSNVALTTVQQVSSFNLSADGGRYAAPGAQASYPHTLVNSGNGTDTFTLSVANAGGDDFDLSGLAIYADANGDGLPDNTTSILSTGPLAADQSFKFVVVGTVPGSANASQTAVITVSAAGTATASPAAAASNTDTTTVTADGVINVTKSMSANSGAPGSGPYPITLTYNNSGNNTATNLTLMDVLPSGFSYSSNSARWSVTGGGTTLTDTSNVDAQGTAPDTVTYDFGVTVAGRVTAVIQRVLPGASGTLTFQVTVDPSQASGPINNTATYSYDPGTGTPVGPFNGNTFQFTVSQSGGVTITGHTVASALQGGTVVFTNLVQNTGNGTDRFDLTLTNVSFPAGTTFALYQSDANTPLVDSSGNGLPDTGPLGAGLTYSVIVKAVLPASAAGVNYTMEITATSASSSAVMDQANNVLAAVASSTVDLSNGASGGAGAGPEGAAVVSTAANPGATVRFTLYATNTSAAADYYDLGYSTNSGFSTTTLPAGWTILFRDANEAVITATGPLAAGANKVIYADVTVGAGHAPGAVSVFFRAVSPTSGASDRLHDAVVVNTVRNLSLAPNNSGQIFGGGVAVYAHLLANNGNVSEGDGTGSSVALTVANAIAGWSAVVYYDGNNSGTVDGGDTLVTNLTFVSAGGAGLAPGETVRLLVQVFSPPGAPLGAVESTTLTATTVNEAYVTAVPGPVAVSDTSAVISGDLRLTKEQALDTDLDGLPELAYSTTDIATGALPGRAIRYRITVINIGSVAATSVRVFDTTPAFTTYTATGPAATTRGSVTTTPADGATGALEFNIGTLNPGESALVTFGVVIAQ